MSASVSANPHLETDIWHWLLFESGLNRRRAREIILQSAQSNALALFWQAGIDILTQQLALTPDETALVQQALARWPQIEQGFESERQQGVDAIRINQADYPGSLVRNLPAERRPLLLFLRGEPALLDLPAVLPVADAAPDERTVAWALDTLADLAAEGAVPLLLARSGFEAQLAKAFLDTGIPFTLVIPQGLAAYAPPAGLQAALTAGRVLLISPFQPRWQPAQNGNPMLPHAQAFGMALADALLLLSAPVPDHADSQPCFRAPDVEACEKCPHGYTNIEQFFTILAEISADALVIRDEAPTVAPAEPELPPLTPEEILSTLAQGGRVPPALAERLKKPPRD